MSVVHKHKDGAIYRPVDIKPDGSFVSEAQRCDYPDDEAGNMPTSEWSPTIGQPEASSSDGGSEMVVPVREKTIFAKGGTFKGHDYTFISTPTTTVNYTTLRAILDAAFDHAATGKGRDRHARDLPFDDQPIMQTTRLVGPGFPLGQAIKKAGEAAGMIERGELSAAEAECLGAINYLAGAVAWMREQERAQYGTGYIPPKDSVTVAQKEAA